MKQIVQNYKNGKLSIDQVPSPLLKQGNILVHNKCSLISTGTERSKIITASKNIFAKAKARPDQVKLVINNLKQEGIIATIKKSLIKLDTPITLGYSCAGDIMEIGFETKEFTIGDKVACMGEGFATHAEINSIPSNLCVKIPDSLTYKQASFVGLGSIAMQGVNNAKIEKGDKVGVVGLGLIGQLTAQILKAYNCEVLGIDIDQDKLCLAQQGGIVAANPHSDDVESIVRTFTSGKGLDSIIVTAASRSSAPLELAAKISKKYGNIVLVGAVPIKLPRKEFFDKELNFIVSHGFGDELIEKGKDVSKRRIYSARENAVEFLNLVSKGFVEVDSLISEEFPIKSAKKAYELLASKDKKVLGVIINYSDKINKKNKIELPKKTLIIKGRINIGFVGAGSFASGYLLPLLAKNSHINLKGVATSRGITSKNIANKFEFDYATSNSKDIFNDRNIDCIVIATRHNLHSELVIEALKRKKVVFVEKPLCLNEDELNQIIKTYDETGGKLMIGFNRRFSPFIIKLKEFYLNRIGPLIINYRINAGYLEDSHWLNDEKQGGGRIVGEICHFVDLMQFITASRPIKIFAETVEQGEAEKSQSLVIVIKYEDNSIATINYNAIGDVSYPRERIEVFGQDSTCVIDNFKTADFVRHNRTKKTNLLNRDMGHKKELELFIDCIVKNEKMPIDFKDIGLNTLTTFRIIESLKRKEPITIDLDKVYNEQ